MATFNKFNAFVEAIAEKIHNLGADQIKVALSNAAPSATNTQLSNITEISYTNCSTRNVTTSSSSQTSGLYKLILADLTLTASGGSVGPFRYVILYNDTATNDEVIGWWDYGSSITLASGESLLIDMDGANGVLQLQ
jgi:hypothetical protein